MEGAPTLRQSTSAQSLLTDSVGSQNSMLSHSMSKSDIFAMRRRLEAQWRMNRTRQIHELRRTFIHFCVNEGLGTATTAPTEQYDRYQADAGIKLLLPKKEVRPSRNALSARGCSRSARTCTHKRLTALVPCDARALGCTGAHARANSARIEAIHRLATSLAQLDYSTPTRAKAVARSTQCGVALKQAPRGRSLNLSTAATQESGEARKLRIRRILPLYAGKTPPSTY